MSTPQPGEGRSSGGGIGRKIGPLPLWGWAVIVGVLVLVYAYYKKSKSTTAAASTTAANSPGGVDASLVPQFINQTYDNSTPPPAPNITVTNNIPPAPPDVETPPPTLTPPTPKPPTPRTVTPFEPIFNSKYTVKKGQTLQQVATQFGITREQLAHANGLGTGAGLRTGQTLVVPSPPPKGTPNKAQ